ncbi:MULTISPECIES: GNAT family N-acetyltransferase [unclassified Streptomyces]|uniref:GNAT family N-acetyltransferase n=1 Tax=unclassified Streptomyces TaxID=2593676 RepID=UPI0006AF0B36|nr:MULTISPECIES: GNAT family N-acetyltransferase [unclassified Streptomyces]KOX36926.1 acetyltransferase [Streptomyces sp. NRRL F-6491]KOX49474.1 acetyltransferase [Streptomyces sp. NRRL F-6492]
MDYLIRVIRADEWEKAREIRLVALQDPVAHLAFLDTYEAAVERPDSFWRERAEASSDSGDGKVRQFVAEGPDGSWAGTITVLVERPSDEVRFGGAAKVDQTHVVGVYVRPGARGAGVVDALFRAGVEWSWSLAEPVVERVRLYVHEENARAAAFYRRFGFTATGERVAVPGSEVAEEVEYGLGRPVSPGAR